MASPILEGIFTVVTEFINEVVGRSLSKLFRKKKSDA